jgi:hypothetical protein
MPITQELAASKIADYLHHSLSIEGLVDWAENAMLDGEFAANEEPTLRAVIGRLGVADVREFGLTWEECEALLRELGFRARVDVVVA